MDRSPITGPPIYSSLKSTTDQFKNGLTLKRHDQKLSELFQKKIMVSDGSPKLNNARKKIINASLLLFKNGYLQVLFRKWLVSSFIPKTHNL